MIPRNITTVENPPRWISWYPESADGERKCHACENTIKKGHLCYRHYRDSRRKVQTKYGVERKIIAYDQYCMVCGLKEIVKISKWAEKELSKYKVYRAERREKQWKKEGEVGGTHTHTEEQRHREAVDSSPKFIRV